MAIDQKFDAAAGSVGEWRRGWSLPFVSLLGISGSGLFTFSSGIFMPPMLVELGWTHTQFALAFMLQMATGLVVGPTIGLLVDRVGPRSVALGGIPLFTLMFALLGTIGRPIAAWWLLSVLLAAAQGTIAQTVWITAVIGQFRASRGLAIAVSLSGLGVASMVWPVLAAAYVPALGWRLAFPAMALTWAAVTAPATLLFLPRGAGRVAAAQRPPGAVGQAWRSWAFVELLLAGGLFACAYLGLSVNLVPMLRAEGIALAPAAAIAGAAGLFSIGGRVATGVLLDRLPTRLVAGPAFLLPAATALLLATAGGSRGQALAAVALLGLGTGAELDVITFIAARRFGPGVFASVYGLFMACVALFASVGPLLAGALRDHYGSDMAYLYLMPVLNLVAAALIFRATASQRAGDPL